MQNNKPQLTLTVLSQEKQLLSVKVDSATIPTSQGEITVLPNHIPLLAQLVTGELVYRIGKDEYSVVISPGFIDVDEQNTVTVVVDAAKDERELSVEKAQQAIAAAQTTMSQSTSRRELLLAEASLKQAMWELKVAQKTRKARI